MLVAAACGKPVLCLWDPDLYRQASGRRPRALGPHAARQQPAAVLCPALAPLPSTSSVAVTSAASQLQALTEAWRLPPHPCLGEEELEPAMQKLGCSLSQATAQLQAALQAGCEEGLVLAGILSAQKVGSAQEGERLVKNGARLPGPSVSAARRSGHSLAPGQAQIELQRLSKGPLPHASMQAHMEHAATSGMAAQLGGGAVEADEGGHRPVTPVLVTGGGRTPHAAAPIDIMLERPALTVLCLHNVGMTDAGAHALGAALRDAASLASLDLGGNTRVSEQGWRALVRGLQAAPKLQRLTLRGLDLGQRSPLKAALPSLLRSSSCCLSYLVLGGAQPCRPQVLRKEQEEQEGQEEQEEQEEGDGGGGELDAGLLGELCDALLLTGNSCLQHLGFTDCQMYGTQTLRTPPTPPHPTPPHPTPPHPTPPHPTPPHPTPPHPTPPHPTPPHPTPPHPTPPHPTPPHPTPPHPTPPHPTPPHPTPPHPTPPHPTPPHPTPPHPTPPHPTPPHPTPPHPTPPHPTPPHPTPPHPTPPHPTPPHPTPPHPTPPHPTPPHPTPPHPTPPHPTPPHPTPPHPTPPHPTPPHPTPPHPAPPRPAPPRHATPRHATPRHATPRHATPRHATPRHATPRHATPRHATPRHATPRHATPRHATPRHATPRHATPRHATPRHATPRHATPRHATPRHATPRHATPRPATPRHATPRHATPRHATPRHATPRHATPRHATPRHATPRHATPRHAPPRHAPPRHATHATPRHATPRHATPSCTQQPLVDLAGASHLARLLRSPSGLKQLQLDGCGLGDAGALTLFAALAPASIPSFSASTDTTVTTTATTPSTQHPAQPGCGILATAPAPHQPASTGPATGLPSHNNGGAPPPLVPTAPAASTATPQLLPTPPARTLAPGTTRLRGVTHPGHTLTGGSSGAQLEGLSLAANSLGKAVAAAVPGLLMGQPTITSLVLRCNPGLCEDDEAMRHLLHAVQGQVTGCRHAHFTHVDLSGCGLSKEIECQLAKLSSPS
ncbi:hypothetical protein QJQ45_005799 [Haematococcus lacustris]|nr:hypothetical protein QJQ45_005799 [Haematococcus lacustris]